MSVVFRKTGLNDLTIVGAQLFPKKKQIKNNQKKYLTQSLKPKVVVYSGELNILELNFIGLTKDNYNGTVNGIKNWFQNSSINWSENNFTLIDEQGTSHIVRYWSDTFEMPEIQTGRYSVKLELLEE